MTDFTQNPYDLPPDKVAAGKFRSTALTIPRPWVALAEIEHLGQVLQDDGCSPDLITIVFENTADYRNPWRIRAIGEIVPVETFTTKAPPAKEGASVGITFTQPDPGQ
ncbi:hypothetical protein UFOVP134_41 [uncultured Caudovirales phage]|uniref:Uncharacterized protein n=1 Tax=uncultured Caudovirales phage TaxID=2100421 RepID=A0A6J5LC11_9CAUD|nr:hypothetical protein UFOVP134_41 [uncultured Caudovirales phage]